jgi:hypothetical protein
MKNNKQVAKQKSEWLTTTRTTRKLMALKKIKSWNISCRVATFRRHLEYRVDRTRRV